jgi:hypothetical protein
MTTRRQPFRPPTNEGQPTPAISGELRGRLAPLPPAADGGRRRAGARQLAPAGAARVCRGGGDELQRYLREVRLRNAALLLARQPPAVRQVALLVGYRQPARFAKAFRRRYCVAPAQYRARADASRAGNRRGAAIVGPCPGGIGLRRRSKVRCALAHRRCARSTLRRRRDPGNHCAAPQRTAVGPATRERLGSPLRHSPEEL